MNWWEVAPAANAAPSGNWWEGAPTAQPSAPQVAPDAAGFAPRSAREADPTKEQKQAAYNEMASGVRERQGAIAKYADTAVRGLARAVPVMDDIAALGDTLAGGGSGGSFSERYSDNLMRQRAMNQTDDSQRPVTSYGSQIVGGVAALPTFGVAANSIKGGAALGAGYGAAYGFGSGDDLTDRALKAAGGGLAGGALGAAVPAIVNGVSAAAGAARNAASPIVGAVNPETEAARRVARAMERDAKIGSSGLSVAEAEAARASGSPVVNADLGGETVRALARSSANTSPEGRAALEGVTSSRFQNQAERLNETITSLSPMGANATKTLEELQAAARAANKPAYAEAYAKGARGIWDNELAQLIEAPAISKAVRDATTTGANRAVADGFKPVKNPFTVGPDGKIALSQNADGSVAYPSLQFWDHVKRNLDDMIESARRAGNGNQAGDLGDLKRALVAKLDSVVPEYAKARQGAAAAFGAQDALEAGQKFALSTGKNEQFASAIAKFKPPEMELFREGFSSAIRGKLSEVRDRNSVINAAFLSSPAARQRIEMVYGREGAAKLEAQLRVEGIMDSLRGALGNSTTARQLAEMGLGGGIGGYMGGDVQSASAGAIAAGLLRFGRGKIDQRVSQKVAEMLSSSDPKVVDRALKMVSKSPAMTDALRKFDAAMVKIGATQVPSEQAGKFISGMNPSRADSEQPNQN